MQQFLLEQVAIAKWRFEVTKLFENDLGGHNAVTRDLESQVGIQEGVRKALFQGATDVLS
ncbi:hypothetical protein FOC84_06635 [Achromobacter pestifer]|uniref:Uncharacterized protein n=1 Tax=Achromobacter pestifer TaxID=1353889 RepID=A0A7D4IJE8_9BURK|nr:hypothetical protein [Achromobacter pestifer]QKH34644.1 hypothetical protein FOC84_06635 [Achromobacter pestifer]